MRLIWRSVSGVLRFLAIWTVSADSLLQGLIAKRCAEIRQELDGLLWEECVCAELGGEMDWRDDAFYRAKAELVREKMYWEKLLTKSTTIH